MRKNLCFAVFATSLVLLGISFSGVQGASPGKVSVPGVAAGLERKATQSSVQATPESAPARAPRLGVAFDDREIALYLEQQGRQLFESFPLPKLAFDRRACSLTICEPGAEKLPLAQIAAQAESATLVFGEFYRDGKSKKLGFSTAAGGFLISETGVCVTCLHVANEKNSRGLVAMTRDGQVFPVSAVLASDPVDDVLVLQLDVPAGIKLPKLALATEPAPIGSSIAVMSHPDERFYMLTTGVVARHSVWRDPAGEEHFMTITADFAKGSSGCPVLDERGAVVGLVNNTESIYYDDDGKKKQLDLQMVVKNTTPSWVVRRLIRPPIAP